MVEQHPAELLDIRFTDLLGAWRHLTISTRDAAAGATDLLVPVDASLLLTGRSIEQPRLMLRPVALQRGLDPFCQYATVGAIGELIDPVQKSPYAHDPRAIAGRAEAALRSAAFADQSLFACELQFFVFDRALFEQGMHSARHEVDSREGVWRRGRDEPDNLGLQTRHGDGYGQTLPFDSLFNLRAEMVQVIEHVGVEVASHHRAAASGAQMSIRLRPLALVAAADAVMLAKYAIRNVCARHGKVASFMPKPVFGDPGSSLLIDVQMHKAGRSLFARDQSDALSANGAAVLGGMRTHAAALVALGCQTTNSYKRLGLDDACPTDNSFGFENHAAMFSLTGRNGEPASVTLRHADSACNPYLALTAIAMSAIDGVAKGAKPGAPRTAGDAAENTGETQALPNSLETALRSLWTDRAFLERDGVLAAETLATLMSWKLEMEVRPLEQRPHPYEFCLYFNS